MKNNLYRLIFFGLPIILGLGCKQQYNPPAIRANPNILVVDGILNVGDSTFIRLSRTRNFYDSLSSIPETDARMEIVDPDGNQYLLTNEGNGLYASADFGIDPSKKYQLQIATSDGKIYASDSLAIQLTPPIDSVNWVYTDKGVQIYVNTHDPTNATKYYRWEYQETWQHNSLYSSSYSYTNGMLVTRTQQIGMCWTTQNSTGLLLASSAGLSQDVIYETPIIFIPRQDEKISVRYSILVKQYGLNVDAYNFWQRIKQNSQLTGGLFDPLPSEINGNIHCVSDPGVPVLGYISASSVQEQRIFISSNQVFGWDYQYLGCTEITVTSDSLQVYFGDRGYIPIDMVGLSTYTGGLGGCVDCTLLGGSPIKPAFWP